MNMYVGGQVYADRIHQCPSPGRDHEQGEITPGQNYDLYTQHTLYSHTPYTYTHLPTIMTPYYVPTLYRS